MWIVQSPEISRSILPHMRLATTGVAAVLLLLGCSAPPLPKSATPEDVPFLGKQMTQDQIAQWREKIDQKRDTLQQTLSAQKVDCYQRFFVNKCLKYSVDTYRAQDRVLRLQEIELARQERVLTGIDRELRLQEKTAPAAQPAASAAP